MVGPGWLIGPFVGRLAPSDWAIGPGFCWGWLARLIGPGWFAGVGPGYRGRLAGVWGDWRGLFGPGLIGAGLAPGRLGGAGRLAPDHANPGGLCNDFPVILQFL